LAPVLVGRTEKDRTRIKKSTVGGVVERGCRRAFVKARGKKAQWGKKRSMGKSIGVEENVQNRGPRVKGLL